MNEELKKQLFEEIRQLLEENFGNRITPSLIEGILGSLFRTSKILNDENIFNA